jgi:hypothetical protein
MAAEISKLTNNRETVEVALASLASLGRIAGPIRPLDQRLRWNSQPPQVLLRWCRSKIAIHSLTRKRGWTAFTF